MVAAVALAVIFHSRSQASACSPISARLLCPAPSSPPGAQRAECRGREGRGARSRARANLRTWHLPPSGSAGRPAEGRGRSLSPARAARG